MSTIALVLIAVLVVGAGIGIVAWVAPHRAPPARRPLDGPAEATTDWTSEAGAEFGGLSESARCDLVFAVAALGDERSERLLEHALGDPAEAVSLAAAHALAGSGRGATVERYLAEHPGYRADRIAQALTLLG